MANVRDLERFFRIMKEYGMEQILFMGMYAAMKMRRCRFITELDGLFRAVDKMKEILMK